MVRREWRVPVRRGCFELPLLVGSGRESLWGRRALPLGGLLSSSICRRASLLRVETLLLESVEFVQPVFLFPLTPL